MRLKNEIFANVLDWLIQEKKVDDQKDLSVKTGISQNTVSRIMTGKVEPSDDTLRKLNAAFGNIFNMQYLRGESVVMLIDDVAYYKMHPEKNPLNILNVEEPESSIDQSSLVNAALAAKDQVIAQMELRLSEKDKYIALLEHRIADLEAAATLIHYDSILDKSPFPIGVAEPKSKEGKRV